MASNSSDKQSPVTSPGKERGSKSPIQRTPSPTAAGDILPGNYWTEAPLDPDDADDPTFEDYASSTASISTSILAYRNIQGRTYHSDRGNAEYWGSNDARQNEAMDIAHHVHTLTQGGKHHLAPLKDDIQKALDIGTGTGLWAVDFGDLYPNCEVIGTDISPIQSTWVPPNVKFEIDDCEQPWTFEENSIDFVHMRYMTGSLKDWSAVFKEAFKCNKPGGYFESFEASPWFSSDDGTVTEKSAMSQWGKLFVEGGKKIGRAFLMVNEGTQRATMEEAGYVDINEENFQVPMGRWPKDPRLKELGSYAYAAVASDIEGYVLYMATMLGWSKEEVSVYAAHLRNEMRNPDIHGYYTVKVVWGRKPDE